MRSLNRLVLVALMLLASLAPAQEVRRHILAIVPGQAPDPDLENPVHQLIETPLNYLGMVVRYHYVDSGPPPADWIGDTRAILTFFYDEQAAPDWLWPYLEQAVERHPVRVVHLGDYGPLGRDRERLGRWLRRLGLRDQDVYAKDPMRVAIELRDKKLCAYEASPRMRAVHTGPRSVDPKNRVWVTTKDRLDVDTVCHPVVTGAWGALALDPWLLFDNSDQGERRWHLDPFAFFREALGLQGVPVPHPAVLNGRRIWFCQIDGDGFESFSSVETGSINGKVFLDQVLTHYELPFTTSVIVSSLTDDYRVDKPTEKMALAKRILHLPNIEPASHGVLHTLDWRSPLRPDSAPRTIVWYPRLKNFKYSPIAEVRDSIRFVNERLLDGTRRCAVMLWTGEANPDEDAIAAAEDAGCVHLNGGVFRWDDWHDSLAFVTPWSRRVGARLQVYAGAANENTFEGFFDTMPGAFAHIDTTLTRTGSPRILKPANLYIHFYSAENKQRMEALHGLLKRWPGKETAPVFASTYARAVRSAILTARITRTPRGWRCEDFGDCRTLRIDDESRTPDLHASRGVLGFRRSGRRLWIHLSQPDADVVLAERPTRKPHVEQANCILTDTEFGDTGVSVTATAHNPRVVIFAGFAPNDAVRILIDSIARSGRADDHGRVTVHVPEPGSTRIAVGTP